MTRFLILRRAARKCWPQPSAVVYYPKVRWTKTEIALSILGAAAFVLAALLACDLIWYAAQKVREL